MTRNDFLKNVPAPLTADEPNQQVSAANAEFDLSVCVTRGLKVRLIHRSTGLLIADGPYSYSFGSPQFNKVTTAREGDALVVVLEGSTETAVDVRHEIRVPQSRPWIEERITLTNRGSYRMMMPKARCGWVLPVPIEGGQAGGALREFRFTAVPFRREPLANRTQYADFTVSQVLFEPRSSRLRSDHKIRVSNAIVTPLTSTTGLVRTEFDEYASEGWLMTDGKRGFLISKYNPSGIEWSVLDRISLGAETAGLRWGGFGVFEGDPEHGASLPPQSSYSFGVTRITAFPGGIMEGLYAFRSEMEARGHGCPKGFNPPVHWNELYDNKVWWAPQGVGDPENLKKYYRIEDMKEEAAKAVRYHCEALYMDPGWDTSFGSKIWDEPRLGKVADFAAMLRRDFGLKLSLQTVLSGWCNPTSYPREFDIMGRDGARAELSLCGASPRYVEETFRRLDHLARDGVIFFMFDGTTYHGMECWDPEHGHPVPARRHEHAEGMTRLARLIHEKHPHVLIEMHDQLISGWLRYLPVYYGHGEPHPGYQGPNAHGFDSAWAFELMWDPMRDLVAGHSIALYYYNLAYSLPLYVHLDLRKDNAQALMLWWNASTCRHLGIGGTHADPQVQKTHIEAMATYRKLKPFFTAGTFYGIEETIHVHRHPVQRAVVINCFNLEKQQAKRTFRFEPEQYGLDGGRSHRVLGAGSRKVRGGYDIEVEIAGYGHTLVEIHPEG